MANIIDTLILRIKQLSAMFTIEFLITYKK